MRYTLPALTVAFLIQVTLTGGCVSADAPADALTPDATVSEVRACRTASALCECSIDDQPVPCGATEVEACPIEASVCTYTAVPACADIECEWMVECDLGGCTCVVGYPVGRLTACTY